MASHLNSVILEGYLTGDPILIDGKADFTLQSIKNYDNDYIEVCEFDVEAIQKVSAGCMKNLSKGSGVRVVGRLKQARATVDSPWRVVIVAEHVEFIPLARKGKAE